MKNAESCLRCRGLIFPMMFDPSASSCEPDDVIDVDHDNPGDCARLAIRALGAVGGYIHELDITRSDVESAIEDALTTALRRAEEAEAIANRAMDLGLWLLAVEKEFTRKSIDRMFEAEWLLAVERRRADQAEAIANLAMSEGLRAVNLAKRLHVYDADGKVLTQAAVNRLLCAYEELALAKRRTSEAEEIANRAMADGLWARIENADLRSPRKRDEWHEEDGNVLWWTLPVAEPPYAGTPLDDDFPDYVTHWTPIVVPVEEASDA